LSASSLACAALAAVRAWSSSCGETTPRFDRFGLADLICSLPLLVAKRCFGLLHLRRQTGDVVGVVRRIGTQFVGRNHGDELIFLDDIALRDQELPDLPADLRADDDVIGRDDARQHKGGRGAAREHVGADTGGDHEQEQEADRSSGHL
jgi:hypothetical protein